MKIYRTVTPAKNARAEFAFMVTVNLSIKQLKS